MPARDRSERYRSLSAFDRCCCGSDFYSHKHKYSSASAASSNGKVDNKKLAAIFNKVGTRWDQMAADERFIRPPLDAARGAAPFAVIRSPGYCH